MYCAVMFIYIRSGLQPAPGFAQQPDRSCFSNIIIHEPGDEKQSTSCGASGCFTGNAPCEYEILADQMHKAVSFIGIALSEHLNRHMRIIAAVFNAVSRKHTVYIAYLCFRTLSVDSVLMPKDLKKRIIKMTNNPNGGSC